MTNTDKRELSKPQSNLQLFGKPVDNGVQQRSGRLFGTQNNKVDIQIIMQQKTFCQRTNTNNAAENTTFCHRVFTLLAAAVQFYTGQKF